MFVKCFQKAARRSQGKVSLGGVADLFQTPPAVSPTTPSAIQDAATPDSVLYADLPDTPIGPGEMMVSPLSSGRKSSSARKSVGVIGVKELFKRKSTGPVSLEGVNRMLKTPKAKKGRSKTVSPAGLKRMLATPKSKKNTEPASPSGVAALFPTPEIKTKTPVKPVTPKGKAKTPKPVTPKGSTVKSKGSRQKSAKTPIVKEVHEPVLVITPVFVEELKQTKTKSKSPVKSKTPVKTRTTRRGQKAASPAVKKIATPKSKQGRKKRPAPETASTVGVQPRAKRSKVETTLPRDSVDDVQPKKAGALKSLKATKQTPMKSRTRRGQKVASPAKAPTPKVSAPSPVVKRGRRGVPVVATVVEVEPATKAMKTGAVVKKTKATIVKKSVSPSPVKAKRSTRGHPVQSPVAPAAKKGKLTAVKKPPSPSPVKMRGRRPVVNKPSTPVKKTETMEEPVVASSPAKKSPMKGRSTRRGGKVVTPAKLKTPVTKRGRKRPAAVTPVQMEPDAKKAKPATTEKAVTPKKTTPAKSRMTRRGKKASPSKAQTPQKAALQSPLKAKRGTRQKPIQSPVKEIPVEESKLKTPAKSTTPLKAKKNVKTAKQPTPVKTPELVAKTQGRSTRRGGKIATPKKSPSPVKAKRNMKRNAASAPVHTEIQPKAKKAKAATVSKAIAVESAVEPVVPTPKMSPKPRATRRGGKVVTPKKSPVKSKKIQKSSKVENEEIAIVEKLPVVKNSPMQKRTIKKLKTPKKSPLPTRRKASNKVTEKSKAVKKMATPQKRVTRQRK